MKAIFLTLMLFAVSCAPGEFKPFIPPQIKIEPTPAYEFDVSKELVKPDKPNTIFLDKDFNITKDKNKSKYVVFTANEFSKIVALNRLYEAQVEIIDDHVRLVNVHIEIANALKELLALKDAEIKEYLALWTNAENAYRQERYRHKVDNAINKTGIYLVTIGSIILLAIGL